MTLIDKAEALRIVMEECYKDREMRLATRIEERIAALPARGVGVKPLAWEPSAINKPWHSAKAPWGWYYAQWDDETQAWFASLEMGEVEAPIILSPSDVPTIEAAKAAAQADYEARILAALAPTDAAQAREVEVYYKLRWIAGARPPVHPEPMNGSQTFSTEEKARAFFRSLASDAKFVSLERIEVTSIALIGDRT